MLNKARLTRPYRRRCQLFISKEEVTYSPDDKYKAMVEKNPHLAELRKLFPNIDY